MIGRKGVRVAIGLGFPITLLAFFLGLILLTSLSFEVILAALLACLLVIEGIGVSLRRGRRQEAVARPGSAVPQERRVFFVVAEVGVLCFAALLMYYVADFSALASLLVLAVGVVSAFRFGGFQGDPMRIRSSSVPGSYR